jgi:hypothetical protein
MDMLGKPGYILTKKFQTITREDEVGNGKKKERAKKTTTTTTSQSEKTKLARTIP